METLPQLAHHIKSYHFIKDEKVPSQKLGYTIASPKRVQPALPPREQLAMQPNKKWAANICQYGTCNGGIHDIGFKSRMCPSKSSRTSEIAVTVIDDAKESPWTSFVLITVLWSPSQLSKRCDSVLYVYWTLIESQNAQLFSSSSGTSSWKPLRISGNATATITLMVHPDLCVF